MRRLIGAVVGSLFVHAVLMANTSAFFKEPPRFAVKSGTSSVRMTFSSPSEEVKDTTQSDPTSSRDDEPENSKSVTKRSEETSPESTGVPEESTHHPADEAPTSSTNHSPESNAAPIGPLPSPDPVEQDPEQESVPESEPVEPEEPPAAHQQPDKASKTVTKKTKTESDPTESSSSVEEPTSGSNRETPEKSTQTSEESLRETARSQARQAGAKWMSDAEYRRNPPPSYPTKARVLGQEGTVKLLVTIDEKGRPTRVEIKRSSGSFLLDQAAQKAVRKWSFVPAREDGQSVPSITIVPIDFELER